MSIPDSVFTLAKAKAFLRVDHALDDEIILGMLDAAVATVEQITRRAWTARTWRTEVDASDVYACACSRPVWHAMLSPATVKVFLPQQSGPPGPAPLPAPPEEIPATDYNVHTSYGHTWIELTREVSSGLVGNVGYIEWTATPAAVPPDVYAAAMLFLGDYYENREAQVVGTIVAQNEAARSILRPYVIEMHV